MRAEDFHRAVIDGGLEAWVWRRRDFANRHVVIATPFGAADTSFSLDGRVVNVPDGTAHFLEHLVFQTERGSALGTFSRLGVRANAFTSHTATAYYFSGTANFAAALRELLGLVLTARFRPETVDSERRVIAQEIRMYEDDPGARAHQALLEALYLSHPVRRRIAGTLESVAEISPATLEACHEAFYHPKSLVLVAAGDLEPQRVFDLLSAEVTRLHSGRRVPEPGRVKPEEPPLPARPFTRVTLPVKRPLFLVGFKDTPPPGAGPWLLFRREMAVNLLLEVLLGPASPLYDDLYRRGLVDETFSARYSTGPAFGHAVMGGATRDADEAAARVQEGIWRRRQKGISAKDLERKKRKARGQYVELADSLEGLATLFLLYRLKGVDLLGYPRLLEEVGLDEVDLVLQELFVPERTSVAVVAADRTGGLPEE
ncbi:MAG: insulinase family protein [Firmicutes bacterium]|nr:insulinase family protein [Bacillota bacterium]